MIGAYRRNSISNKRLILIGVSFVIVVSVGVYLYDAHTNQERMSRGAFTVSGHSLSIFTAPVKSLPEHVHEADVGGVDSVLSPGHGVLVNSAHFTVPFDMWVTGVAVETEHGPRSLIHHAILFRNDRKNPLCPERDAEIVTIGADSAPLTTIPSPYGMFVKKGTELYVHGMLHNPAPPRGPGGTYTNVAIGFTLTFVRSGEGRTKPVAFYRFFLGDNAHCTDLFSIADGPPDVFVVPPSVTNFVKDTEAGPSGNTARFTFTENGTIIGTGGHVHPEDGGTKLEMLLNGKVVDSFEPQRFGNEPWQWITVPRLTTIPIQAGDQMHIRATYTNPYPFPVRDAMGHGAVLFAPSDPSTLLK